jgi:hypothetical protein
MKDFKPNRKMGHGEPTNMCWGGAMKKARGGYAEGGMRSESTQNARAKRELSDAYEDAKPSYNPIKNISEIVSGRAMEKGAALSNALDRKKRADMETGEYKKGGMAKGGKNWIAGAIKHKGALHRDLGVPMGQKIPASKLAKAEHSLNPTIAKRARLAKTLASFK